MKNLFFILVMLCATLFAHADDTKTCPVRETTGEVSARAYISDKTNGKVIIHFTNDTKENVSIRYTIRVKYDGINGRYESQDCNKIVYPGEEDATLSFGRNIYEVQITSFTGTKCSE